MQNIGLFIVMLILFGGPLVYLAALITSKWSSEDQDKQRVQKTTAQNKQRVYIAHPLKGNIAENRRRVDWLCREIMERRPDVIPVSPIHAYSFLDETVPKEREYALTCGLALQETCDATWVFGCWEQSEGCLNEWKNGRNLGHPVLDGRYIYKLRDVAKELRTGALSDSVRPMRGRTLEVV